MIEIPNKAIFVHVPKCGGTWIRDSICEIKTTHHGNVLPLIDKQHLPHFGFIRNPWAWYVSWYNFSLHGSDIFPTYQELAAHKALRGNTDFDSYIKLKCRAAPKFKDKLFHSQFETMSTGDIDHTLFKIAHSWLDRDQAYLELMYDMYLGNCVKVGKVETIADDFIVMLNDVGVCTPDIEQNIKNTAPINIGNKKVDYRTYYTDETAQLVADTHQRIITKHGYTFDK